jgi:hypothetical protein
MFASEEVFNESRRSMIMEQRVTGIHIPFWKRCLIAATFLLCVGPFVAIPSFAHPATHTHITGHAGCIAGNGGFGGIGKFQSTGGGGGGGGDCTLAGGHKGGGGGTILNGGGFNDAAGGDVFGP